jgi:NAD(P)H-dependent FMN reductase
MSKKIQLIIGSTREGRNADKFATWVQDQVAKNTDIELEVVDLKDWDLPFMTSSVSPAVAPIDTPEAKAWSAQISKAEGFIFLTSEYNRSIPASLKNAFDYLKPEWEEKPAAVVSYGFIDGGASATNHLRDILDWFKMPVAEPFVNVKMGYDWLVDGQLVVTDDKMAAYADQLQTALKALAA